ncbi:MAG: S24/S26 family peptidase [Propionicimonas sp.]|nr:S24/S26 family peptidase [Propionicimonas sp.]
MTTAPVGRAATARRLGAGVAWALLIGVLVLIWPSSLGGCTTLTVITGHSMEPTLQPGDFAVLRCGEPTVGDVIAYRPFPQERSLVIHRITGGDGASGWHLQGDNNEFVDPFYPVQSQVQGIMLVSVPKIGTVLGALGLPWVWGSAFLAAAALLWFRTRARKPESASEPQAADIESGDDTVAELDELLDAVEA